MVQYFVTVRSVKHTDDMKKTTWDLRYFAPRVFVLNWCRDGKRETGEERREKIRRRDKRDGRR